jgi:hypothetical protein
MPKHTFIVLSQIQGHAAAMLEELAFEETHPEEETASMDNSLDSMIDTFTEVKELLSSAMDNFRRSNLTVIHRGGAGSQLRQTVQLSVSGLDVWRRAVVSLECTMKEMHLLIQAGMNWKDAGWFRFYRENQDGSKEYFHDQMKLGEIDFHGRKGFVYEYGKWNVNIIIMSSYQSAKDERPRFIAGENAAPPEHIDGTRHFKKLLHSLETGSLSDKQSANRELGKDFPQNFDLQKANRRLSSVFLKS